MHLTTTDPPLFSICHTSARPQAWRRSYDAWIAAAADESEVEYVLCADTRWGFIEQLPLVSEMSTYDENVHPGRWEMDRDGMNTLVWNWHRKCMVDGYAAAVAASTGSIIILNSDDITPPEHWDVALAELAPDLTREFVIHVSTGYYDGPRASSIQILSRARLERLGYAMWGEYESLYADDDFIQHAYFDHVAIDARHLMFPHQHPATAEGWDEVYRHQNRMESRALGADVLARRILTGFGSRPLPLDSEAAMAMGKLAEVIRG